jgi:hypothetical protein
MKLITRALALLKKFVGIPEKKEKSVFVLRVDTVCDYCKWEGNFMQTLIVDDSNDACPRCGNTELTYIIGD